VSNKQLFFLSSLFSKFGLAKRLSKFAKWVAHAKTLWLKPTSVGFSLTQGLSLGLIKEYANWL
jgi:hypothetical protein